MFFIVSKSDVTGLRTNGTLSGSGISTNIIKITSNQTETNGGVAKAAYVQRESILISNSGYIKGDITFDNCVIDIMSNTASGTKKILNFENSNGNNYNEVPDKDFILTNGTILNINLGSSNRKSISISELSNKSSIVRKPPLTGNGLFVYTEEGGRLSNSRFENIKCIEANGFFREFYNVDFVNTDIVMLNYNGGRIDRFGINVDGTMSNWDSWLHRSYANSFWDWNPRKIRANRIIHGNRNDKYCQGYTASFKFIDKNSDKEVSKVSVEFKDNRNGVMQHRGSYTTNSEGVLVGKYNSQFNKNETNQVRPSIFFLTKYTQTRSSSDNTHLGREPSSTYRYDVRNVSIELEIKSYAHQKIPKSFTIDHEYGLLDEKNQVKEYYNYYLKPDNNITNNDTVQVSSYTQIDDLNQLYDVSKLAWRNNKNYPLLEIDGGIIKLPSNYNLIVDPTVTKVYSVSGQTITVKSNFIAKSDKFYWIQAPSGTINFRNGGYIDAKYTDRLKTAYVRLKYFKPDDRIRIYSSVVTSTEYDREGQGGFAYIPNGMKYKIRMDSRNGTEAMQEYVRAGGTDNEFYVNFTASINFFGVDDRIELYGTNQKVVEDIEIKSTELRNTETKVYQLLKEIQHVKTK
jgi:hypothetical protein